MDKKLPQNLDPKLKEVYDRVMGFTPQPAAQTPAPAAAQPIPKPPPASFVPSVSMSKNPSSIPAPAAFVANNPEKKNQSMSPVVLVVLAVVFFLVYAVFWVKFFRVNLPIPISIPFLNQ